jgi:arsenate reductase
MRHLFGDRFEVHSAGVNPLGVHGSVDLVLGELGIDTSGHRSKHIDEYKGQMFDYVVTVCDHARQVCPFFPGKELIHHPVRDPVVTRRNGEDIDTAFRAVRDEIKAWLVETFGP